MRLLQYTVVTEEFGQISLWCPFSPCVFSDAPAQEHAEALPRQTQSRKRLLYQANPTLDHAYCMSPLHSDLVRRALILGALPSCWAGAIPVCRLTKTNEIVYWGRTSDIIASRLIETWLAGSRTSPPSETGCRDARTVVTMRGE